MKSGLLWKCSGEMIDGIVSALKRYGEKYGMPANMVFVSEGDRTENTLAALREKFPDIQFGTKKTVMPNYIFVGVREETVPTNQ